MTVKLLSEEELLNLDADAPGYDVLDRLVGVHQWAAKARAAIKAVAFYDWSGNDDDACRDIERLTALLAELTPPTPEERR